MAVLWQMARAGGSCAAAHPRAICRFALRGATIYKGCTLDRRRHLRGGSESFAKEGTETMKKIISTAFAGAALMALSACGSSDDASEDAAAESVEAPADDAMTDVEAPVEDEAAVNAAAAEASETAETVQDTAAAAEAAEDAAMDAAAAADAATAAAEDSM
ncbi:hypothetical protein [Paraurantiacibacter namhicola]|nr:hypothetical protein [Paraurantiacibacter namhicola]